MKPGKPGTARYQRYLNMRFLMDLDTQLSDAEDEGADATDPRDEDELMRRDYIEQEESFFANLFDPKQPEAMRAWAPFVRVDVDEHDEQVLELSSSLSSPKAASPLSNMPSQHALPARFLEPLQRCVRNAAYYMLLCSIESHVVHYLDFICAGLRCKGGCDWGAAARECRFVEEGEKDTLSAQVTCDADAKFPLLSLTLADSYQRLLCHAVCAYYMLQSESLTTDGRRVTTVAVRQTPRTVAQLGRWLPSYPKVLLVHHVLDQ